MQKNLPDNILSLYEESLKTSIDNYKKGENNKIKEKNYQYYYSKSMTEINLINTTQVKAECLSIENQINARVKQLNLIKQKLIDSNEKNKSSGLFSLNSTSLVSEKTSLSTNSKNFSENYSKDIQSLMTQLNDLMIKIDNLSNSPFDSMKKAKSEYDNKCELILQPLINSMIEKRKYYNLVMKEKESKLKIVEEKKTTLTENRMKIERLTKEFNENSEKMTTELKQNDIIQKELEQLIALNNKSQPASGACKMINIPEDQLNIIISMKKKLQIAMMNVSDRLSMINHYQKNINANSLRFVFLIVKIAINLLLRKKQKSLENKYEDSLFEAKKDKENLIKEYNELVPLYKDVIINEENQQQKLLLITKRLKKLEAISAVL